jgi:hypothetical protein
MEDIPQELAGAGSSGTVHMCLRFVIFYSLPPTGVARVVRIGCRRCEEGSGYPSRAEGFCCANTGMYGTSVLPRLHIRPSYSSFPPSTSQAWSADRAVLTSLCQAARVLAPLAANTRSIAREGRRWDVWFRAGSRGLA